MKENTFVSIPIEMGILYEDPVPEILTFNKNKKYFKMVFYLKKSKYMKEAKKFNIYLVRNSKSNFNFELINKVTSLAQVGDTISLEFKKKYSIAIIDNSNNQGFCYTVRNVSHR